MIPYLKTTRSVLYDRNEHRSSLRFLGNTTRRTARKTEKKPLLKKKTSSTFSEADIQKLKFRTRVPERIIRQALLVFDRFDLDNSGAIQRMELKDALFSMGVNVTDAQLTKIMNQFDEDGDGVIDVEEFLQMVNKIGLAKSRDDLAENDEERENILCAFIALGGKPDKSGEVSTKRLKGLVDSFGLELDVEALLAALDEDGDGTVDYHEFAALFSSQRRNEQMAHKMMNIANEPTKN